MPALRKHTLRPAVLADVAFLEQLYADTHRAEFLSMSLPEAELNLLLKMQFRAQRTGYANDFADAIDRIVLSDDPPSQPIGRFLVATRREAIHLVDIALLPAARGQGIGTSLLMDLLEHAQGKGLPVRLQVRPGNPAFQLYSRLGFRVVGGGMNLEMEFTPGSDEATPPPVDQAPPSLDSEPHPLQYWFDRKGRAFRVMEVPPESFPPLILKRLDRIALGASISHALIFHGPLERHLPQAMYSLRLCDEASLQPLETEVHLVFLVPIGPSRDAMQYEAVFS